MKSPIFILGAHKAGTSLLRSLLDGHPDLFVVPLETHIFQAAGYWVDYALCSERPQSRSFDEIKKAYTQVVSLYNSDTNQVADANLVNQIDIEAFRETMQAPVEDFKDLIGLYFKAIYTSLYRADMPAEKRVVEKSVEHAEFAADLQKLFPDAKFVHILRNPYANIVALRKSYGRNYYIFFNRIFFSLYNSWYYLYRNQRVDNYKIIRYEDLLTAPETTMRQVALFLGIPYYDEVMNQPTSLGQPWAGNSSRGLKFNQVATRNLDLWEENINLLEILVINMYFKFVLCDFGYEILAPSKSALLNRILRS